jgi:hypothetical protein
MIGVDAVSRGAARLFAPGARIIWGRGCDFIELKMIG